MKSCSSDVFDLCVVGAGIAGLNALFAATQQLPSNARVALVDRNSAAGGMWNGVYDYVRLHQPHPMFTAGNIPWTLSQPREYLATGQEVLAHLDHCLDTLTARLCLTTFWRAEAIGVDERCLDGGALAQVEIAPVDDSSNGRQTLLAKRLIYAKGLDVPKLEPLRLNSKQVVSCTPESLAELRQPARPMYVVGGGKTGVDTALMLADRMPQVRRTLLAGDGTLFSDRGQFFPTGWRRYLNRSTNLRLSIDISERFDGTNAKAVFEHFRSTRSIAPGSRGEKFLFGMLSADECRRVEQSTDLIFGYLDDVVDGSQGPELRLRGGGHCPVEAGSVFINCTGHLFKGCGSEETLCSPQGTTLTISSRAAFNFLPAISSYFLANLFLSERLEARLFYYLDLDALLAIDPKVAYAAAMTQALLNPLLALGVVQPKVLRQFGLDFDRWHPPLQRLAGLATLVRNRARYVAHCQRSLDRVAGEYGVLCGPIAERT
ncbi:MAG: FAD-dependent oxidoreductase [Pseudomonadota bacterium]